MVNEPRTHSKSLPFSEGKSGQVLIWEEHNFLEKWAEPSVMPRKGRADGKTLSVYSMLNV